MYLQSIDIKSFGQLQNFKLAFVELTTVKSEPAANQEPTAANQALTTANQGPAMQMTQTKTPNQPAESATNQEPTKTLLIWPNESGKSTIVACIRALFYGLGNNSSKNLARRQQYLNFNKQPSEASLKFSHAGCQYELGRYFGKTNRSDKITLFNLTSGEQVDIGETEPGYFLFALTEEQFINSLLVEQMSLTLPSTSSAPDIVEALTNLGLTGNSSVNVQKAQLNIEEQLKTLRFKRGQGGLIFACEQKIASLNEQIRSLTEQCQAYNEDQLQLNALSANLAKSEQTLQLLTQNKQALEQEQRNLASLEREQADLLDQQYQAKAANEAEYKAQMAKSFNLASKVSRLENELNLIKQTLETLNVQRKKTSQRQLANKTKLQNWQQHLVEQDQLIQTEAERLQAGEGAIKECVAALTENSEKLTHLQKTQSELQSKKEKLTIQILQAVNKQNQAKKLAWAALLSLICTLISGAIYLSSQLSCFVPISLLLLTLGLAVGFSLVKRKVPAFLQSKKELEQIGLSLADIERQLLTCKQAEIDYTAQKLELISQNKHNYLDNLLLAKEASQRDVADLQTELAQAEQEINEQNNERQAKQLLQSHVEAELKQAQLKANEQKQLVEDNEKFIKQSQVALEQKSAKLQSELDNNVREVCDRHSWPELSYAELLNKLTNVQVALNEELEKLHASLNQQHAELSAAMLKVKEQANLANNLQLAKSELKTTNQALASYKQQEEQLELANKLLTSLFTQLQNDFSPKLRERCSYYLQQLSLGHYTELTVDKKLHLQLRYKEDQAWHVAEYLSGAAYEQVYLALRLALCDLLVGEQKLPLLLDDCLVQFDREHQMVALQTLSNFAEAKHSQILLFTCHSYMTEVLAASGVKSWQIMQTQEKGTAI